MPTGPFLAASATWLGQHWPLALTAVWLAIALALLARLGVCALAARRELAGRIRLRDGGAFDMLFALCRDAGRCGMPRLSVSDSLTGPVSLPNGEICLPSWALDRLAPAPLRAMLAHELAHCRRRDPQWQLAATVTDALLFMQPLNRTARGRVVASAELACDDWAATQTGNRRALAECLAECATRLHASRLPAFASAMAAPGSALTRRVGRLLSGIQSFNGEIPMKTRITILAALLALAFTAPGFLIAPSLAASSGSHSVSVSQNDGDMSVSISENGLRLKMHADGKFAFNDAENGIATLADGSELEISATQNGATRRAIFFGKNGGIEKNYYINGKEQPFDANAQKWLASVLPQILRESAINAKARIARILKRGGPDAVLAEIGKTQSGYARSVYIRTFAQSGTLKPAIVDKLIAEVAGIDSGYEKEQALTVIYKTQHPRGDQLTTLLKAGSGMDSAYETSQLLQLVAAKILLDKTTIQTYLGMTGKIDSDYEMSRALSALLARSDLTPAVTTQVIAMAAEHLGSPYDLRTTLGKAASRLGASEAAVVAYCQATTHINSSYDKREALATLLRKAKLQKAGYMCVLDATTGIDSDYDRATLLMEIARQMPNDSALVAKYRAVAKTISSAYERSQAEDALRQ